MNARYLLFFLVILCLLFPYQRGAAEQTKELCPKPHIDTIFPWAAKPGALVKIQGRGFGFQRGEVIFAEKSSFPLDLIFSSHVKAEIMSWTSQRILVIVPKSAASGSVFVQPSCGSESNKKNFTVNK